MFLLIKYRTLVLLVLKVLKILHKMTNYPIGARQLALNACELDKQRQT